MERAFIMPRLGWPLFLLDRNVYDYHSSNVNVQYI